MSGAVIAPYRLVDIPDVGTVIERSRGHGGWVHRNGTGSVHGVPLLLGRDREPVDFPTEADARCWLLAYHFQLGIPAAGGLQGGEAP